jgi:hypothetical protein
MDTTKEIELKLHTFIVTPQNIRLDIPVNVGIALAYTTEEAVKLLLPKYAGVVVNLKPTGTIDLKDVKAMFGKLFESPVTQVTIPQPIVPIQAPPIEEIIVAEPNDDKLKEFSVNNLQFIIDNEQLCAKLNKTDISALKRVIKKLWTTKRKQTSCSNENS